jgi:hypothetical protein
MKEEIEGYIKYAYEQEEAENYKNVYVTDH